MNMNGGDLYRTLQYEIRTLSREIEAIDYQLTEKRRALELLKEVAGKLKVFEASMPRRRTKQKVTPMIFAALKGKKKPIEPKFILEQLAGAGYLGSSAVVYATLGRLVRKGLLVRGPEGGYMLPA
ncbi:MAG: hypothetical protein IT350_01475 [Deltaproteobacteria bacterium]|nr:hypothetical protein [Deltaproteobacteria bacterium]